METVYFYCAAIGGGILVLQTLLMMFGLGDTDLDADVDTDVDADVVDDAGSHGSILMQLSLKTVVAFFTFFGLAGLACLNNGLGTGATVGISIAAGLLAFYIVGWLMSLLTSLQSKGNLDLRQAIGSSAKVYLRIPAEKRGAGKITVAVQGRTVTRRAVTGGDAIPTGTEVVIRGMTSPDTFEVTVAT